VKKQVGDIILFSGKGAFSAIIQAGTGSKYSHVAMYAGNGQIFESTSIGNTPDAITGKLQEGVQLTDFDDRVANYEGKVFYRSIKGHRNAGQEFVMAELIQSLHGTPYEQSNWELASAALDHLPWHANKGDESSLFCSELAAKVLRAMEILPFTDLPTNEFTPADFSTKMKLEAGYCWDKIYKIK
jgi:hypothetical protein